MYWHKHPEKGVQQYLSCSKELWGLRVRCTPGWLAARYSHQYQEQGKSKSEQYLIWWNIMEVMLLKGRKLISKLELGKKTGVSAVNQCSRNIFIYKTVPRPKHSQIPAQQQDIHLLRAVLKRWLACPTLSAKRQKQMLGLSGASLMQPQQCQRLPHIAKTSVREALDFSPTSWLAGGRMDAH